MNLSAARPGISKTSSLPRIHSGTVYGLIIIMALVAFESFNFSTTAFALKDLLGDLKFANIPWSTFLAVAFCAIDFAGIARLINPETRASDLKESWYLFGAWLLAATANAALTWWGVAVAINGHLLQSAAVISTQTLTRVVPVFIAILVWVIRILIIASLTSAIERLTAKTHSPESNILRTNPLGSSTHATPHTPVSSARPLNLTRNPRVAAQPKAEPTYHDLFAARNFSSSDTHQNHNKSL
ncbi:MAG: hypothetical protein AB9897_03650 [Anaerolineaceae bacterium]